MRAALILAALLWGAPAFGQELPKQCAPGDPSRCSQPLRVGELAPFTGQLLTPKLALDLGQKADGCDARTELEVEHAKALAAVDLGLQKQLLEIERQASEEQKRLFEQRLKEALPPWYERPPAVAAVTVVATGVVFFLAVKTVEAVH